MAPGDHANPASSIARGARSLQTSATAPPGVAAALSLLGSGGASDGWLDADVEQYLCEGPGRGLREVSIPNLLRACGVSDDDQAPSAWKVAGRSLHRLGWTRDRPDRLLEHSLWRRNDTAAVPRPGFETVVRRQLAAIVAGLDPSGPSSLTITTLVDRLQLAGLVSPQVFELLDVDLTGRGWQRRIYAFPHNGGKRVFAWERPRQPASGTGTRQQVIDAPPRRRRNTESAKDSSHTTMAGRGRGGCEGRRGSGMR